MEKDISWKWKRKKAGVATLISDKMDFKTKTIVRDKEEHYMTKRTIQQEDINCEHLFIQHRNTWVYKANLDGHKGRDQQ